MAQRLFDEKPLPKAKLYLFITLFVVGVIISVLLYKGLFEDIEVRTTIAGIVTTLFIVSLVELIPEVARVAAFGSRQVKFRRFFGEATFNDEIRLVFADRKLKKSIEDPWDYYAKEIKNGAVAEGASVWLAIQDVRGAAYLANTIHDITGKDVRFVTDRDFGTEQMNFCVISMGLGFNGVTHRLTQIFSGNLFSIKWGKSLKDTHLNNTDFFDIRDIDCNPKGNECDVALVARVVPPPEHGKTQKVWFVCAGRTASGTVAAGYFLAERWNQLMDLYQTFKKDLEKDSFVALLEHVDQAKSSWDYPYTTELGRNSEGDIKVYWAKSQGM